MTAVSSKTSEEESVDWTRLFREKGAEGCAAEIREVLERGGCLGPSIPAFAWSALDVETLKEALETNEETVNVDFVRLEVAVEATLGNPKYFRKTLCRVSEYLSGYQKEVNLALLLRAVWRGEDKNGKVEMVAKIQENVGEEKVREMWKRLFNSDENDLSYMN